MKRVLVALAALVGLTAAANADYVLIRAVLGGKADPNNPNSPGGPGGPGGPPGGPPRGPGGPGGPGPGQPPDGTVPVFNTSQTGDHDTAALAVQCVVPASLKPSPTGTLVITKYSTLPKGFTRLYNDGQTLMAFRLPLRSNKTVFESRRQGVYKNRTSDKVLDLADWALTHGLLDEYSKLMDDLAGNKEDDSSSASPALKSAVKAYKTVKASLDKAIDRDDQTEKWKRRLGGMRYEQSKHYTVFYNAPVANPPEVQSRLAMLEQNMRGFYFYFAMKGMALPMPDDKMVCVQLDQPDEFKRQRALVEDEPLVTDGFYAQRDNICVFSSQRLDAAFQVFTKQTQPIWQQGFERQTLLDGTAKRKPGMQPAEYARFQTLALLEKSLEEEGERAAVSHEGTRQLYVAAGIMPRNVVIPQWALFGTAAFFETPKGPFPGAPQAAQVAFYGGFGAPSWAYLRAFKNMDAQKRFPSEAQLLQAVVTDGLFNSVINAADRQALLRARTTAWALGYYLCKVRLPGLIRYCQELSSMPRDMEMSDRAVLAAFARAFDIANAQQDGIDPAKFDEFAKHWVAYIRGLTMPGAEFGLEPATMADPNNPGNNPGNPADGGGPGGRPGGGRPGGGPGGSGGGQG